MKTTREVITELSKKVEEIQLKVVELPKKVKTLEGEIARAIEYEIRSSALSPH
jgi:chaperonin cofactor prefoldin